MSRLPLITSERVLALLQSRPLAHLSATDVGDVLGCTRGAAANVLRRLVAEELVVCTGPANAKTYALPAGSHGDDIVQPFKPDMRKPPIKGYEAKLRAVEDLAMLTRRA